MYVAATAPRSIGGVLDDTIQLYRASLAYCWLPGLIFGAIYVVLTLVMTSTNGPRPTPAQTLALFRSPQFLLAYVGFLVISVWAYCAMVSSTDAVASGTAPRLAGSFMTAFRSLPGALIGSIAFGLAVVVGTVLLILPGIFLWIRMQFWIVALVAEREGPFTALGTSWRLVAGNWWRAFTIISVVLILMVLMIMLLAFVLALAITPLHPDSTTRLLVAQLSNGIWYMLMFPMLIATLVSVYRDLKLRKEGGDLAARLGRLQPT